jgi:hypothetical protein
MSNTELIVTAILSFLSLLVVAYFNRQRDK